MSGSPHLVAGQDEKDLAELATGGGSDSRLKYTE